MIIYSLLFDKTAWTVQTVDGGPLFLYLEALTTLDDWSVIQVALTKVNSGTGARYHEAEFLWDGAGALCLSRAAVDAIGELLVTGGELLPLACDDGDFCVFRPFIVADQIDFPRGVCLTGRSQSDNAASFSRPDYGFR